MIYIIAGLLVLAAISNSIMDTIDHHYDKSIFLRWGDWWSPYAWRNKYKDGEPWKGERFLGSTTVFVFVTDAWHCFKFIMLNCFIGSIILLLGFSFWVSVLLWAGGYCLFGCMFTFFYNKVLLK